MKTYLASLALVCVCVATAGAQAGSEANKELARTRWAEGTRLYDVGEYRQALDRFKSAYLVYEEPAFLYNMAQCYRQLHERAEAIRAYRSYLRRVPDAPNRAEVEERVRQLDSELAKSAPPPAVAPAPPAPAAAPATVQTTRTETRTPAYKRWWVWTLVAGVAVAGAAVGVGVWYATRPSFSGTLPGFSHSGLTVRF